MQNIDSIIDKYMCGLSLQAIATENGCAPNTIKKALISAGVQLRDRGGVRAALNERYFSVIDTEEKAYFAGMMLADGSVVLRDCSPCTCLELNARDLYIVQKFRDALGTPNKIVQAHKECVSIGVHSKIMADDLAKYGVIPNKTCNKRLMLELIPQALRHHFIRGFFDGNGYVTLKSYVAKNGNRGVSIGFCDYVDFLLELEGYLRNELSLKPRKVYKTTSSERSYFISYGDQHEVSLLANYMYKDATVFMHRKLTKLQANIEVGLDS